MGKESKVENKSGINVLIVARDGLKKIDEYEVKLSPLLVRCLSYEPIKAPISTDVRDLEKQRRKFVELKRYLEKYTR
jgi:hypothetical protein